MSDARVTVALFVTCLVDMFRPSVGFAAVRLLEQAGCQVAVPAAQTCCGQPGYNAGDRVNATRIARQVVDAFDGYTYVVAPSGSCAGMIRNHYPNLLAEDPVYHDRAVALANRTWELMAFLVDVLGVKSVPAQYSGGVTYHDSCSSLREVGTRDQPRLLLRSMTGLQLLEAPNSEVCCGFGGTFSVKYSEISIEMVDRKVAALTSTEPDTIVGADLGCLLNIAGRLKRQGKKTAVRHVAEILAGETKDPAIGEGANDG
ncbi:MAG: (Fe-S)-binding protein [Proteobacteria bacterium]|nr:(Fe-S)-binding protein [Pseudomonadota bacterium]